MLQNHKEPFFSGNTFFYHSIYYLTVSIIYFHSRSYTLLLNLFTLLVYTIINNLYIFLNLILMITSIVGFTFHNIILFYPWYVLLRKPNFHFLKTKKSPKLGSKRLISCSSYTNFIKVYKKSKTGQIVWFKIQSNIAVRPFLLQII